ncbi:hypothetical protein C2G38_2169791 [Gigaspora rosea]|uniref:Sel1 repeat-containing protein n=1 Tax=Gigaspora rosea TaxID=44941 RepID=A0A397VRL4_9GLOM|nr:hypothetical protein C2G38_2169791 [Gigaspora rosea]
MKNLKGFIDNHQENFGIKSAEESLSIKSRTADRGNINGMYSIGYCYQNGFEDEHKASKYYKKSADAGSTNRTFIVDNYYLKEKNSNRLYNLKLCSQNGASVIEEEKMLIDLDPIKDKCSKIKDLKVNRQQRLNINLCTNCTMPKLKNNIKNTCACRGQIKKISPEKDIGNSVNSGIAIMHKISNSKDGKKCNKKKVVVSHSRMYQITQWFRYQPTCSPIRIFDPGGDAHLNPSYHPKETLGHQTSCGPYMVFFPP